MDKSKEALKDFGTKYNCSQAVISVFSEELGLDKELALKLSKGFGGGAARGELCGAVSGGIMALGLKYGDDSKLYIDKFEKRIEELYGSIRCEEMLGYNVSDENENKIIENKNLKTKMCPKIVEDVTIIVEQILKDN